MDFDSSMPINNFAPGNHTDPAWIGWVTGSLLSSSLASNCLSLTYIISNLKINSHVATLLKLDTGFKIGGIVVSLIAFILIGTLKTASLQICSLHIHSFVVSMMSSYFFQPAIAVVR